MAEKPTILAARAVAPSQQSSDLVKKKLAGAKVGSVKEWQQKWNAKHPDAKITVDGTVGQQTLSAMRSGGYKAPGVTLSNADKANKPDKPADRDPYGGKGASPGEIGVRAAGSAINRALSSGTEKNHDPYGGKGASPFELGIRKLGGVFARSPEKKKQQDEASAKAAAAQKTNQTSGAAYEAELKKQRARRGL